MSAYLVRLATAADAEAISRIYNQGIEDRVATLETEPRTPEERRRWLAGRGPCYCDTRNMAPDKVTAMMTDYLNEVFGDGG